jgi:DNA-binding CsgD family transcriptional regulator
MVRRTVNELVAADVFAKSDDLEFAHPILRSALADVAGGHALSEGHARAIELLERSGADPEVVAAHVMAMPAAADSASVDRLLRAAQVAGGRGASGAAVAYLRRALEEPPAADKKAEVLLALGSAEIPLQDPACFFHLLEARDLFPPGPEKAEAGLAVTRVLAFAGEISMALAEGAKARGLDRETDLFLDAVTMAASMTGHDHAGVAEVATRSEGLPGHTPGERAALALAAFVKTKASMPLADIGPILERVIANGGVTITAADGFSPSCVLACVNFAGQHRRSITLCTQLIQEAERSGSPFSRAQYAAIRAGGYFRLGRLVEAAADARFAIETAGAMNVNLPIAHMMLVESLIALGRLDEAQEAVDALPAPGEREDLAMRASATWTHGHLLAERGDFEAGITVVRESGRLIDQVEATNPAIIPWRITLVELLARNGELDRAQEEAVPALAAARRHGGRWTIGRLLRGLAMSRRDDALALLTEAIEVLDDGESQFALAEALVDLGAELRRRGQRRQAREPLAEGLRLARECGAAPLAARAEIELHAGGANPRTTARTGLDSLTPSEWRVAQLAAQGGGNREIAQSLFVTEKTVEKHLGNAYRKLGITKRSQLMPLLRTSERLVEE